MSGRLPSSVKGCRRPCRGRPGTFKERGVQRFLHTEDVVFAVTDKGHRPDERLRPYGEQGGAHVHGRHFVEEGKKFRFRRRGVVIHQKGHDAFVMQGPYYAHGRVSVSYHIRSRSFAAGGDEGLHGFVVIAAHHHHARPRGFIELAQHGGQQLP